MTFHYQSLAEPIKDKIVQGELNAGQKLISLRQFAKLNNISLNTATRCYELLEAQGFVSAKNKSGYFVNLLKKISMILICPSIQILMLSPEKLVI